MDKRVPLLLVLCPFLAAGQWSVGQITFNAQDLPRTVGAYYRAYVVTNGPDVSAFLNTKGGPVRWDFSASRASGEDIYRIDVVASSDGGHGASFPQTAYAERTTHESTGAQAWSYYQVVPAGRDYFGFYDPISNALNPLKVFDSPTIDVPKTVAFNQTWQREVDFQDLLDAGFGQLTVLIHFTCQAAVDAYGTVVLPNIGELPALRVNELHTYELQDTTFGLPLGTQYVRNYYWLAKSIGQVVNIISNVDSSAPPADNFGNAATVLRVFESSSAPPTPHSVSNLVVSLKGSDIFLKWDREGSASAYRVEASLDLGSSSSWKALAASSDNFLFDPLDRKASAKFYRVFYDE